MYEVVPRTFPFGEVGDLSNELGYRFAVQGLLWNIPVGCPARKADKSDARVAAQLLDGFGGIRVVIL
jgi:hypothetical protein